MKPYIRWMIRKDLEPVIDIENKVFEFPWKEEDFVRCLRQRHCIGMVAEFDDEILGYMIYELFKEKLHVYNFAVHPKAQRTGVGKCMVDKLKGKLSHQRRYSVNLEIRESNLAAQLFFRKMGFRATCVLKGFYDGEDAYAMVYLYTFSEPAKNRITKWL